MILFLSDHPINLPEHDGMAQRIAAIDRCFSGQPRSYLKVSLLRHLRGERQKPDDGSVAVWRLNLFLHLLQIIRLILSASCLYCHSIGNLLYVLPLLPLRPYLIDLHGLVSDEFLMAGRYLPFLRYRLAERIAIPRAAGLVVVSEAMMKLTTSRYPRLRCRYWVVPVFDDVWPSEPDLLQDDKPLLIYAGGAQVWQNVELMLSSYAQVQGRCRLRILTGEIRAFQEKLAAFELDGAVELLTVPKQEVYQQYRQAVFGFILRDNLPVNRVACPTKLVEYLAAGLVPIVLQPEIGDFVHYGYAPLLLERLLHGELPDQSELEWMRQRNRAAVVSLRRAVWEGIAELTAFCQELEGNA